mmetsp:Transcript_22812/g.55398  ORF Transcript_22812/g.55398 Transcript_22812/m.55398 type:complete len:102 (-) Transcript_22812:513-818(-)
MLNGASRERKPEPTLKATEEMESKLISLIATMRQNKQNPMGIFSYNLYDDDRRERKQTPRTHKDCRACCDEHVFDFHKGEQEICAKCENIHHSECLRGKKR